MKLKRFALFALVAALAALPLYAMAQLVHTGDPTIDAVLAAVPAKYWTILIGTWSLLFYVVCPLVLKQVKLTPESGPAAQWAVKLSEYITQNTHRPPPIAPPEQQPAAVAPSAATKGFATTALLVAVALGLLAFTNVTRAEEVVPAAPASAAPAPVQRGILSVQLGDSWGTHADLALGAFGYDFTTKKWTGTVPVTGLYVLSYKPWADAGLGAGGSFMAGDGGRPVGSLNVALVSPGVVNPFQPVTSGSGTIHLALIGGWTFGPDHSMKLLVALPFQF